MEKVLVHYNIVPSFSIAERHAFEGGVAAGTLELATLFNTFRKDINHLLIQLSATPRGFDEEVTQAQHAVIRYIDL